MRMGLMMVLLVTLALWMGCQKKVGDAKPGNAAKLTKASGVQSSDESPRAAFERFRKATATGDADGIWSFISEKSRRWMAKGPMGERLGRLKSLPDGALAPLAKAGGTTVAALKKMTTPQLARVVMVAEAHKNRKKYQGAKVTAVKIDGARAVLTMKQADGRERRFALIREGKQWKVDGEETKKLETPKP